MGEAQVSPLDIAELSLIEASRWQREALQWKPTLGAVAQRRWRLEMLLRRGDLLKGKDLARSVGCSIRTLYRDMAALRADGMPVRGAAGVGYLSKRY
jgi:biotin operon repressor